MGIIPCFSSPGEAHRAFNRLAGNHLRQQIASDAVPSAKLTLNYRQVNVRRKRGKKQRFWKRREHRFTAFRHLEGNS
jgi:hypothetical protein